MNERLFVGQPVELTDEGIAAGLNKRRRRPEFNNGKVVMVNKETGTVTVRIDGENENRVYLARFWKGRVSVATFIDPA